MHNDAIRSANCSNGRSAAIDNDVATHTDGMATHCGDTSTRFFHIEPRPENAEAGLSKFLRTDGSRWRPKDPADRGGFLSSEMEDRKQLYHKLLNPDLSLREIHRIRGSRQGRVH